MKIPLVSVTYYLFSYTIKSDGSRVVEHTIKHPILVKRIKRKSPLRTD